MSAFYSALKELAAKKDLSRELAKSAMSEMLQDTAEIAGKKPTKISDIEIAQFIIGLQQKGEQVEEVLGLLDALSEVGDKISLSGNPNEYIDTCGTGGDKQSTLNISTLAALVIASGGVKVVKHGNVSATSQSGSADILDALGVNIHLSPEGVRSCVENVGFGFCFARYFHPSFGRVAKVRREIQERTVFNVLGPLSNPASVGCQLVGVSDMSLADLLADVLIQKGIHRALIVHSKLDTAHLKLDTPASDSQNTGLDEISTLNKTQVIEITNKQTQKYEINPEDFVTEKEIEKPDLKALQVSSIEEATQAAKDVISGKQNAGLDIVALNAGAAFYVAEIKSSIKQGYELAHELLASGKVAELLEKLKVESHQYKNHKLSQEL